MPEPSHPKYPTEFMFEFRSVDRFLFRASDLRVLDDHVRTEALRHLDDCHIHLLGKRPRLSGGARNASRNRRRGQHGGRVPHPRPSHGRVFRFRAALFAPEEVSFTISDYPHRELVSRNAPRGSHRRDRSRQLRAPDAPA